MSNLFSAAPVLIDTSVKESTQVIQQTSSRSQFFNIGGAQYAVLHASDGSNSINVFKSVNSGTSWVLQDGTHAPTFTGAQALARFQCRLMPDNVTILVGYIGDPGSYLHWNWAAFSTVSGTWVSAAPSNLTATGLNNYGQSDFVVRSDGSVVLACPTIFSPNTLAHDVGFQVFAGVSWTALAQVTTNAADPGNDYPNLTVTVDQNNITHILAKQFFTSPSNTWKLTYGQVTAGNAVANVQTLTNPVSLSSINFGFGVGLIWQGSTVVFPVYQVTSGLTDFVAFAILVTPLVTPTSFAYFNLGQTTVAGQYAGSTYTLAQTYVDSDGLHVAWGDYEASGGLTTIVKIFDRKTTDGATFAASTTLYDASVNPPNALPFTQQGLFALNIDRFASPAAIVAMNDAALSHEPSYFLKPSGAVGGSTVFKLALIGVKRYKL